MPNYLDVVNKIEFPTPEQGVAAIQVLIDVATGKTADLDVRCVTKAVWLVSGYGASQMVEHPTTEATSRSVVRGGNLENKEYQLEKLEEAKSHIENSKKGKGAHTVGAFPWMMLIDIVYQILSQWLQEQQPGE